MTIRPLKNVLFTVFLNQWTLLSQILISPIKCLYRVGIFLLLALAYIPNTGYQTRRTPYNRCVESADCKFHEYCDWWGYCGASLCKDDPNWTDSRRGDGSLKCVDMTDDLCQKNTRFYSSEATHSCPNSCGLCKGKLLGDFEVTSKSMIVDKDESYELVCSVTTVDIKACLFTHPNGISYRGQIRIGTSDEEGNILPIGKAPNICSMIVDKAMDSHNGKWQCQISTINPYNKTVAVAADIRVTVVVHGNWSPWGMWSDCSSSCATSPLGVSTQTRTCTKPEPKNNGNYCSGGAKQTIECNRNIRCPGSTKELERKSILKWGGLILFPCILCILCCIILCCTRKKKKKKKAKKHMKPSSKEVLKQKTTAIVDQTSNHGENNQKSLPDIREEQIISAEQVFYVHPIYKKTLWQKPMEGIEYCGNYENIPGCANNNSPPPSMMATSIDNLPKK